ncbi:hypothetical protein [Phenylobacterium sp.]|uniref:hypothetical protein n=1 Tax=Phenylobacterium sp. TaxID=1871053 RepID=UPI00391B66BE
MADIGVLYDAEPRAPGGVLQAEAWRTNRWPGTESRAKATTSPPAATSKEQHEFARSGEVEKKAREAEDALEGPAAEELERARRGTAVGKTR